jgi:hypothetical protein
MQPFVPATPHEIAVSALLKTAWTNFIKGPAYRLPARPHRR